MSNLSNFRYTSSAIPVPVLQVLCYKVENFVNWRLIKLVTFPHTHIATTDASSFHPTTVTWVKKVTICFRCSTVNIFMRGTITYKQHWILPMRPLKNLMGYMWQRHRTMVVVVFIEHIFGRETEDKYLLLPVDNTFTCLQVST